MTDTKEKKKVGHKPIILESAEMTAETTALNFNKSNKLVNNKFSN